MLYQLVGTTEPCSLSEGVSSIPATPLSVSVEPGSSALNVMERAADLDANLNFTVSNVFGLFYSPVTIAGTSISPQCLWCLTYHPHNSQEIVIPELDLQNFVIPAPGTTLRMAYTSTCQSSFQTSLANKNVDSTSHKCVSGNHFTITPK